MDSDPWRTSRSRAHAARRADRAPALELRAYAVADVDPSRLEPSCVLETADADRREDELVRSSRGRLLRPARRPRRRSRRRDRRVTRRAIVRGVKVEIGGVAVRYDPVAGEDVDGVEATFRSSRVDGGTYFDLALRVSESDAPARKLAVDPTVWCAEPKPGGGAQMFHGKMPLELELPRQRFASVAGSFVVAGRRRSCRSGRDGDHARFLSRRPALSSVRRGRS